MKNSCVRFSTRLPSRFDFQNSVLIYDRVLEKKFGPWIRRFPRRYGVRSGEYLKAVENFAGHAAAISKVGEGLSVREMQIVALGGGSVGDFAGFVASVFKRGVRLVHVPSTWLSAIDSAHGGKTALNVGGIKNQIGTFYPASEVLICRDLLLNQGPARFDDAKAEAAKVALLTSAALWTKTQKVRDESGLFRLLPDLIRAKLKIVALDPKETSGHRHLLNFGHTVGHALESSLHLSHGEAVSLGLRFAIDWAGGALAQKDLWGIATRAQLRRALARLKNPARALAQDKKMVTNKRIRFIFVSRPGYPSIREVSVSDILAEIERQKNA
ncbi:MAG: 3-dehydroquinate synthase [Bdellovibrionaceae bacterium]|nr:3-dehydroquinate synthase [Pseudobdellovibrionaceae bacterium]